MLEEKSEGIVIEEAKAQIPPPLLEEKEVLPLEEKVAPPSKLKGMVPLEPSFIRLVWRAPGEFLAWRTGFEGWKPSEEMLADIVELYQQLDLKAPLVAQALILPIGMYGIKWREYQEWKRAGKPGLKKKEVGTTPPPDRGG